MNTQLKKGIVLAIILLLTLTPYLCAESSTTAPYKFIYPETLGTSGYVIDEPGYYVLVKDIAFDAAATATYAMNITTSNVTINLNDHAIFLNNGQSGINGIEADDVGNITIKNGTISGFTDDGINLENVTGYNILNCTVMTSTDRGLDINNCYDGRIVDCNIIQNGNFGFAINRCKKLYVKNSHFDNNTEDGIVTFNDSECGSFIFEDCTFNNNGDNGIVVGSGILRNCTALENIDSGFFVSGDVELIQCTSNSNGTNGIDINGCKITSFSCYNNTQYGVFNRSATSIITGVVAGNNGTANYGGSNPLYIPTPPDLVNMPRLGSNVAVNNISANIAIPN